MARNLPGTSSDVFTFAENAAVDITGLHLSLFCWFKPDSLPSDSALISKAVYSASGVQYILGHDTTGAYMQIGDGGNYDHFAWGTLRIGIWQAIVATKSPTHMRGMIGGGPGLQRSEVASTRTVGNLGYNLVLGTRHDGGGGEPDGVLAHVAMWDAVLIDDEMLALVRGASPSLIRPGSLRGYWPLSEYGNAKDRSRYGSVLPQAGTMSLIPFNAPLTAPPRSCCRSRPSSPRRPAGDDCPVHRGGDGAVRAVGDARAPAHAPFIASTTTLFTPAVSLGRRPRRSSRRRRSSTSRASAARAWRCGFLAS